MQEEAFISLCRDDGDREAIDDIVFGAIDDVKNGNIGIDEITMWGGYK